MNTAGSQIEVRFDCKIKRKVHSILTRRMTLAITEYLECSLVRAGGYSSTSIYRDRRAQPFSVVFEDRDIISMRAKAGVQILERKSHSHAARITPREALTAARRATVKAAGLTKRADICRCSAPCDRETRTVQRVACLCASHHFFLAFIARISFFVTRLLLLRTKTVFCFPHNYYINNNCLL